MSISRLPKALAASLVLFAAATSVFAQNKPFPDEWFYSGAQRPADLKKLEGQPMKDLTIDKWIGDAVNVRDQKGKVVIVDFWATWCGPCMASIPHNVEMVKKYKDKGLVFVGIHDANSGWDSAASVVKSKNINYPIGLDKAGTGGSGLSAKAVNLQFWPTYIAIDKKGIVRAAGLMPNNVEKVVEQLLAEAGPAVDSASGEAGEFPANVYYAGNSRPAAFKSLEGKMAPQLIADQADGKEMWINKAVAPDAMKDHVVVLHFLSTTSTTSLSQMEEIAAVEKDFGPQGVVFIGVSSRRGDWTAMQAAATTRKLTMPIFRDANDDSSKDAAKDGLTAKGFGLKFAPATIVIDRAGKVRAAGVRTDKLPAVINKLMAERVQGAPAKDADPTKPGN